MIQEVLNAIGLLFQWPNPLFILGGVLFGMLIGFLPGMAGSVALALLIPVSFTMEPTVAVLFLIGAYSPAGFGGMLTSILVNTPGDPENAATTFDGYPMAKQGRAGAAIGAATAASVLGGLFGTAVLLLLIPVAERSVLSFSYPEFLMLAVLGLCVIAVTLEGTASKGFLTAGLGFLTAFIGLDPIVGNPRFTFDQMYLWDGIDIVPVLIGLFAGSEVLALFGRGATVADDISTSERTTKSEHEFSHGDRPVTVWEGVVSTFRHWFLVIRASAIGTVVGIIPGVGGTVSGFLAYSHAKQTSKHPEGFGRGSVEGVIAAESANDAKAGGALLPTVSFGIPGTVGMAILLGALIMQGLPVGPTLLVDHPEIIYTLIVGMTASKFIAPFIVWAIANQSARLTSIRPGLFTPIIVMAALVGTFTVNVNMLDVMVALIFAYIGYAMRRYGFSRIAFIIALVLGETVERTYFQTVNTFGSIWSVFERPISGVLAGLSVLVLLFALWQGWKRMHRSAEEIASDAIDEEELSFTGRLQPGRLVFSLLLIAFAVVIVQAAMSIDGDASTMPTLIGIPVVVGLVLLTIVESTRGWRQARRRETRGAPSGTSSSARRTSEPTSPGAQVVGEAPVVGHAQVMLGQHVLDVEIQQPFDERRILKRQLIFGAWAIATVGMAWIVGFNVTMPIAMLFFLLVIAREGWVRSLLVAVGTWLFLYGIFDFALGVSLSAT